jgi:predicted nucleic acid-binding protein
MILADTSVWVDHFRAGNRAFAAHAEQGQLLMHPAILGELACGNMRERWQTIGWMRKLPQSRIASDDEVMILLERHKLWGRGIGWTDAHLIASALLSDVPLWTRDRRLAEAAAAGGTRIFPPIQI